MTTKNETAAYVAASLIVPLGLKSLLEALKAWEQAYDAILDKMGPETAPVTIKSERLTDGGRQVKVVSQEDIQGKITNAQRGRVIPVRSGELPEDAAEWATKRGFTHVYDNRWAQVENPKRPAFKAVDEDGHDIKDENGKSMSFWGAK